MAAAALSGLKVVELGTMVSGPYCGKILGDFGAEVIKVEPNGGDPARLVGPFPEKEEVHPEKSALFLYNNTSKRGVSLDLSVDSDRSIFENLIRWTDVLIDNHRVGHLDAYGLDWKCLRGLNPRLICTRITPYGLTGPRASVKGDELTLTQAGGIGNLLPSRSEDVDRAPIKLGGYQVGYHGGVVAALATLGALLGGESNRGTLIDISLQEVLLSLVSPLMASTRYQDSTWRRVPDRPPAMGRMQTRDGYVILNAFDDHHFEAFRRLMGNPDWCQGEEWASMAYRTHHLMDIAGRIDEWMLEQAKDEIHHRAGREGIPIGPINTAEDVMASPQYAAREFFVSVDHPEAGRHRYAGWPYRMAASPPRSSRPAPLLGEHREEVLTALAENTPCTPVAPTEQSSGTPRAPLEGIRVLELCWVWAGPYAGSLLASLGAEVIKVEGHNRMDLMRRSVVWPLPEPAPRLLSPNQGLAFSQVNLGKKSLAVDLSKPGGVDLVLRLAAESDVVIDNMRPGALTKLGLGYDDLRRVKEDIVVGSSSGRGYVGEERDFLGFAMVHQGIGGGAYITGYPDDHPCHSGGDVDLMNAMTLAVAVLAALHHRRRSGEGQFIDYSQCEGVSSLLGEMLLGYEMTGKIPERQGNRHPFLAPHNVYRAWGVDRWVAVEVHDDAEFAALVGVIGRAELALDPRFLDAAARKRNEEALDELLGEWMRARDRDWIVAALTEAGVMASPSRDARDLYADRHLQQRDAFVVVDHPELGELELVAAPWKMDGERPSVSRAPLLGEHTDAILSSLLGLDREQLGALREQDVIF